MCDKKKYSNSCVVQKKKNPERNKKPYPPPPFKLNSRSLRRNIHSCPKEVKAAAYTTLVRPSIEFASSVWDPYTRNNIHQLEAIQRRAARFVYNNFYDSEPGVVTSMISRSQWESIEQRRAKTRATFMYKIANNLVDVHAEHILTPSDNRTRGNAAYRTLYTNADVHRYSFFPRTMITWNTIPPTLRQVNTIDQFQAGLGPSPYQCYPKCKYAHSVVNCIYDLLLAVQKGHARTVNTQYSPDGKTKKTINPIIDYNNQS